MTPTNGKWKARLTTIALTIATSAMLGAFGFAWDTHGRMAVIETNQRVLIKQMDCLTALVTQGTNLDTAADGERKVLKTNIDNLEKALNEHKARRNAHQ